MNFEHELDAARGRPLRRDESYSKDEVCSLSPNHVPLLTGKLVKAIICFTEIAKRAGYPLPAAEKEVLRHRVAVAVERIEKRVAAVPASTCKRVLQRVPMEAKQDLLMHDSEPEEYSMLAADEAPTRATLRPRAHTSRAWHGTSWLAYPLMLFRGPSFRVRGVRGRCWGGPLDLARWRYVPWV